MSEYLSDQGLLKVVGERLTAIRISRHLTQQQVAEAAGLGLRTVQRLETGAASTRLSGFFRVCHVLGVLDRLDRLLPEPAPDPTDALTAKGGKRQRVRTGRSNLDNKQ